MVSKWRLARLVKAQAVNSIRVRTSAASVGAGGAAADEALDDSDVDEVDDVGDTVLSACWSHSS
jgi:hypothetical protein